MLNTFIIHKDHLDYLYSQKLKIYQTKRYNDEFVEVWVNEDTEAIIKAFYAGIKFAQKIHPLKIKY